MGDDNDIEGIPSKIMTANFPSQCRLDKDANAVSFYVDVGRRKVECLVDVQYLKSTHGLASAADSKAVEHFVEGLWCITEEAKELIAAGQPEPVLLTSLTLQSARKMNEIRNERLKSNNQCVK